MGETCGRCKGDGVIPHFSHVCKGICFRCWGSGEDVTGEIKGMSAWLVRARREYATRAKALKTARDPKVRADLQKELDLLAKAGKTNRKKFDRMMADQNYLRDRAREMGR